jgi:hypothetical protein
VTISLARARSFERLTAVNCIQPASPLLDRIYLG